MVLATAAVLGPADRSGRLRRIFRSYPEAPTRHEAQWPWLGSLDFTDANAVDGALLPGGWSFPERSGRWTTGIQASVIWRIDGSPGGDIACYIDAIPALHKSQPGMTVEVFVNDQRCAKSTYGRKSTVSTVADLVKSSFVRPNTSCGSIKRFRIPNRLARGQTRLLMTFFIRFPLIPAEHNISDDLSRLGSFFPIDTVRRHKAW